MNSRPDSLPDASADREVQFFELVAHCLECSGELRDSARARLLKTFPERSTELNEFFSGQTQLDHLVAPLFGLGRATAETDGGSQGDSVRIQAAFPELSDYQFLATIARGGMGIVYQARQISLGRIVALKMIRSAELATEEEVRKFREEAQRVAMLDHPNIVPVYEIGDERGRPYFTMRLMERGSLADLIKAGPVPQHDAAEIISLMARAVHFAHQRGVLHRDIKPGNILFDADRRPQIGDFGLAQQLDRDVSITRSMAIVGTPMYMAPEQVQHSGSLTTGVDVHGLGAVLYELLTRRPPFRAENAFNTLLEVAGREPQRPRAVNRRIDPDLETICLKCLEKDPDRRYGSADALSDDLDRWLRNEPILARRASVWRRMRKWIQRSPALASMSALSITVIAICLAALIQTNARISQETLQKSEALEARTQALQDRTTALQERTQALDDLQSLRQQELRRSYFQSIALAERELVAGNIARVEQILEGCPAELRSWEWNYLRRLCHGELQSFTIKDEPTCIACDSQSDRIYVGGGVMGKAGAIRVVDSQLKSPPRTVRMHADSVTAMALSPDGLRLASAGGGALKIGPAFHEGAPTELVHAVGVIYALAFSPDGKRIAGAGADPTVSIWDAESGKLIQTLPGHRDTIWCVAFSPDGTRIASCSSDRSIKLWDSTSRACLRSLEGHKGLVRSVAFSADGRRLVSAAYDSTARVWDAVTGNEQVVLTGHTGALTRANFSSDGQRIITASADATLRLWEIESGETAMTLRGHTGPIWDATWCADQQRIVSVASDGLKMWEGTTHGMPHALGNQSRWTQFVQASDDGNRLAIVHRDESLEFWSTRRDVQLFRFQGNYSNYSERNLLVLSGDGRFLVTPSNKGLRVRQTDDGREVSLVPFRNLGIQAMTLDHEGHQLAILDMEQELRIVKLSEPPEFDRLTLPAGLSTTAARPNTNVVESISNLLFSRDGHLLALIAHDEKQNTSRCLIWNVKNAEIVADFSFPGHRLVFSPDSSLFATFGGSGTVIVWSTASGVRKFRVDSHRTRVRAVAFSPSVDRLLAADDEGTVTIWDIQTAQEVLALRNWKQPIDSLTFPDGNTLLGISHTGAARRWPADAIVR